MARKDMNFINCQAWRKVKRSLVEKLARKPISTRFIVKVKDLPDGKMKRKMRVVVQAYNQIPALDYMESLSCTPIDTAIRMIMSMFLHNEKKDRRELQMFYVHAAFLNTDIEMRMFVERPQQ